MVLKRKNTNNPGEKIITPDIQVTAGNGSEINLERR
jgi:hypothetical protein